MDANVVKINFYPPESYRLVCMLHLIIVLHCLFFNLLLNQNRFWNWSLFNETCCKTINTSSHIKTECTFFGTLWSFMNGHTRVPLLCFHGNPHILFFSCQWIHCTSLRCSWTCAWWGTTHILPPPLQTYVTMAISNCSNATNGTKLSSPPCYCFALGQSSLSFILCSYPIEVRYLVTKFVR